MPQLIIYQNEKCFVCPNRSTNIFIKPVNCAKNIVRKGPWWQINTLILLFFKWLIYVWSSKWYFFAIWRKLSNLRFYLVYPIVRILSRIELLHSSSNSDYTSEPLCMTKRWGTSLDQSHILKVDTIYCFLWFGYFTQWPNGGAGPKTCIISRKSRSECKYSFNICLWAIVFAPI